MLLIPTWCVQIAMLFVRSQGGSHSPRENVRLEDIGTATAALYYYLAAQQVEGPSGLS